MIWHLIDTRSVGGAERHIASLIDALRRQSIPAQAVLYRDYGTNPWLEQLAANQLPARVLGGSIAALLDALYREPPALLHTHGYKAGVLGRIAARLCGVPAVSTFHSGERGAWPVGAYEWLDEWTAFLAESISVSPAVQRRLPFRSTMIPSFVSAPMTPNASPFPPRVGFVGRLNAEKGPDQFCALAELAPPGLEWHVFGGGSMRSELERGYGGTVTFHGVVTDLSPVWPSLGLLIMPSRFEGVPLAALEALAMGVPVLASRVGSLPDIVIDDVTGWLFEPGSLTDALNGLRRWRTLTPERQAEMRLSCWRHVREHFSEAEQLPRLLAVYRQAGYGAHNRARLARPLSHPEPKL